MRFASDIALCAAYFLPVLLIISGLFKGSEQEQPAYHYANSQFSTFLEYLGLTCVFIVTIVYPVIGGTMVVSPPQVLDTFQLPRRAGFGSSMLFVFRGNLNLFLPKIAYKAFPVILVIFIGLLAVAGALLGQNQTLSS